MVNVLASIRPRQYPGDPCLATDRRLQPGAGDRQGAAIADFGRQDVRDSGPGALPDQLAG